ncbi:hypothetical protein F3Y22_tig00116960pilonHSYRG00109 [Hibiscus syriacus]|uniref:Pyruvate kinase barrel domain-containing protein n=1 Tax=Hibiscus syriacus TaxID=106335 RepID=A0A6A2WJY1_HIBSY|nr:hypothetical protein F3Y22_tig00116960pilonHSYRG00109 [Hibiscus syriacus]
MTKIVGTLGPRSLSVDVISGCLKAGMSVARFDFSWHDPKSSGNFRKFKGRR